MTRKEASASSAQHSAETALVASAALGIKPRSYPEPLVSAKDLQC